MNYARFKQKMKGWGLLDASAGTVPVGDASMEPTATLAALIVGLKTDKSVGAPALKDDDWYVGSVQLNADGALTLAHTTPGDSMARNVIVTTTKADGVDAGNIVIVGTDIEGTSITETLAISDGVTTGTKCFASITSATLASYVASGTKDTIKVGFGDLIGLVRVGTALPTAVDFAILNGAIQAVTTVIGSTIAACTIDGSAGTYNATKKIVVALR